MDKLIKAITRELPGIDQDELVSVLNNASRETINNLIEVYVNKNY